MLGAKPEFTSAERTELVKEKDILSPPGKKLQNKIVSNFGDNGLWKLKKIDHSILEKRMLWRDNSEAGVSFAIF